MESHRVLSTKFVRGSRWIVNREHLHCHKVHSEANLECFLLGLAMLPTAVSKITSGTTINPKFPKLQWVILPFPVVVHESLEFQKVFLFNSEVALDHHIFTTDSCSRDKS